MCPVLLHHAAGIDHVREIVLGVRKHEVRMTDRYAPPARTAFLATGTPASRCAASTSASLPVRPMNRLSKRSSHARSC